MNWDDFLYIKEYVSNLIQTKIEDRLKLPFDTRDTIDLHMIPIVTSWNKIPFSYTANSCSGIPAEHNRSEYIKINDHYANPEAGIYAFSFSNHPGFESFFNFLEDNFETEADLYKSDYYKDGSLFMHVIDVNLNHNQKKDLEYLNHFWENFSSTLDTYIEKEFSNFTIPYNP